MTDIWTALMNGARVDREAAARAISQLAPTAFGEGEAARLMSAAFCRIIEPCSVGAVVADLQEIFSHKRAFYAASLPEAEFAFVDSASSSMGAECAIDRRELVEIFGALIDRSVRALGGGVGVVRVIARVGYGSVMISIEDNGQGFSDELKRRAGKFGVNSPERFDALRGPVERLRMLAHACGGRAESTSRLGAGARVDIELPRVDDHTVAPRQIRGDAARFERTINAINFV